MYNDAAQGISQPYLRLKDGETLEEGLLRLHGRGWDCTRENTIQEDRILWHKEFYAKSTPEQRLDLVA